MTPKITETMLAALRLAVAEGSVVAGLGVDGRGRVRRVSASSLRGLERRGLVLVGTTADGNLWAEPTDAGRAALAGATAHEMEYEVPGYVMKDGAVYRVRVERRRTDEPEES